MPWRCRTITERTPRETVGEWSSSMIYQSRRLCPVWFYVPNRMSDHSLSLFLIDIKQAGLARRFPSLNSAVVFQQSHHSAAIVVLRLHYPHSADNNTNIRSRSDTVSSKGPALSLDGQARFTFRLLCALYSVCFEDHYSQSAVSGMRPFDLKLFSMGTC